VPVAAGACRADQRGNTSAAGRLKHCIKSLFWLANGHGNWSADQFPHTRDTTTMFNVARTWHCDKQRCPCPFGVNNPSINQCSMIHPSIHPSQTQTPLRAGSCSSVIDDDAEVSEFHFQTCQPSFCLTLLLPPDSFKLQIL
jgi:hypothetical protein